MVRVRALVCVASSLSLLRECSIRVVVWGRFHRRDSESLPPLCRLRHGRRRVLLGVRDLLQGELRYLRGLGGERCGSAAGGGRRSEWHCALSPRLTSESCLSVIRAWQENKLEYTTVFNKYTSLFNDRLEGASHTRHARNGFCSVGRINSPLLCHPNLRVHRLHHEQRIHARGVRAEVRGCEWHRQRRWYAPLQILSAVG